jgi:hypothetical protein
VQAVWVKRFFWPQKAPLAIQALDEEMGKTQRAKVKKRKILYFINTHFN